MEKLQINFEKIDQLPACDFFYCYHSLHFATANHYDRLWNLIIDSIIPDGVIAISVFGKDDELVLKKEAIGISELEIRNKFKGFTINYFKDSKTESNDPFHSYDIIATKSRAKD